ncbi:MAG TPA: hypothetical protein IAA30_04405 [Candidatus Treponema faecavium]|nr:hypothetical protein [Candidatus Treponema faecavium]
MQSANVSFADGKQKICNRQVRRWPSAKFKSDKRQNKILPAANFYFLNGKTFAVGKYAVPLKTHGQTNKKRVISAVPLQYAAAA